MWIGENNNQGWPIVGAGAVSGYAERLRAIVDAPVVDELHQRNLKTLAGGVGSSGLGPETCLGDELEWGV